MSLIIYYYDPSVIIYLSIYLCLSAVCLSIYLPVCTSVSLIMERFKMFTSCTHHVILTRVRITPSWYQNCPNGAQIKEVRIHLYIYLYINILFACTLYNRNFDISYQLSSVPEHSGVYWDAEMYADVLQGWNSSRRHRWQRHIRSWLFSACLLSIETFHQKFRIKTVNKNKRESNRNQFGVKRWVVYPDTSGTNRLNQWNFSHYDIDIYIFCPVMFLFVYRWFVIRAVEMKSTTFRRSCMDAVALCVTKHQW